MCEQTNNKTPTATTTATTTPRERELLAILAAKDKELTRKDQQLATQEQLLLAKDEEIIAKDKGLQEYAKIASVLEYAFGNPNLEVVKETLLQEQELHAKFPTVFDKNKENTEIKKSKDSTVNTDNDNNELTKQELLNIIATKDEELAAKERNDKYKNKLIKKLRVKVSSAQAKIKAVASADDYPSNRDLVNWLLQHFDNSSIVNDGGLLARVRRHSIATVSGRDSPLSSKYSISSTTSGADISISDEEESLGPHHHHSSEEEFDIEELVDRAVGYIQDAVSILSPM